MTTLHRIVVEWAGGGIVGRAVNVLHWDGSDNPAPPVAAIFSAYNALASSLPMGVTITVPNTGDSITDTTGDLAGVWASTGGGTVTSSTSAASAAGVGACIGWQTGGIVSGTRGPRKLRGRTFIVPLQVGAYDTNGTLTSTGLTVIGTLANALQAAGPLAVWHRPTSATASDGTSYGVISNRVRDKVAYLSSRRD